jgi:hypothetical protein
MDTDKHRLKNKAVHHEKHEKKKKIITTKGTKKHEARLKGHCGEKTHRATDKHRCTTVCSVAVVPPKIYNLRLIFFVSMIFMVKNLMSFPSGFLRDLRVLRGKTFSYGV